MEAPQGRRTGNWLLPLLKLRIWLAGFAEKNELQVTLFWAGVVGFLAGASSVAFRKLTEGLLWLFTHHQGAPSRCSGCCRGGSGSPPRPSAACSPG